jgi:hypothetical protein
LKKCCINISRYFFLILFLGFFGSNIFFDHTHIYDGNIIVHSHPFKPDHDGKPLHNHNQSGYLLVYQLNNLIVNITLSLILAFVFFFLSGEVIARTLKNIPSGVYHFPSLLRGPPAMMVI